MPDFRRQFAGEDDPRAAKLREDLDAYYRAPGDYPAFMEPNWKPEYWGPVKDCALGHVARKGACRILEVGAGRTSFGTYLGELRDRVRFDAQDVTPANREHLATQADAVHIGDAGGIRGRYDIVFSTFAWEHIGSPRRTMRHLVSLLEPGGTVFVASPRYDFPFYLSPSAKHLGRAERVAIALWLLWRRAGVFLGLRKADFLLHLDPAILRGKAFRDADAIHWPSLWDLHGEFSADCRIERIRIPASGLLGRFWEKYLLLFVAMSPKAPTSGGGR